MPRHSIDSCAFQLHAWRPFHNLPPNVLESSSDPPNGNYASAHSVTKRPCLSDRATSFPSADLASIDISKLSLSDERAARRGTLGLIAHRKRRRRGSRSISGRSCSVGAASAAGAQGTCSDFPMAVGTDSSGELFGNGGEASWASDVSEARNPTSSSREKDEREGFGCSGQSGNFETALGNESGYGSEPGYRGDGELGDGDEMDEEEEDGRLLFWGDPFGGTVGGNKFSDQKVHHRGRRKKNDCRMIYSPQTSRASDFQRMTRPKQRTRVAELRN